MSSDTEKLLSHALNVFNDKLSDRQVIKLEGMEDYLKVPQYKALVNLENKATQLEVDALTRIMDSKMAYLKAAQELRACEKRWFDEIRNGMDSLDERDKLVKDVNMKMRKGDYSILQPAAPAVAPSPASPRVAAKSPAYKRPEAARPAAHPVPQPKTGKVDVTDIKKRLAMMNLSIDSSRSPLQPKHTNKLVEITETPKPGPMLSSKGSLDGSLVHNRVPNTPLRPENWDVPPPNFDDTIDAPTPVNPLLRGAPHRPLPFAQLKFPDENEEEEKEEADDTFPLARPSLPFQTPTVPNSRPFLLSSLKRTDASSKQQPDDHHRGGFLHALPPRPIPTPVSSARPTTTTAAAADPLGALGLMKLKRPVLNSDVGKKLMGQL